jgi:hypothetical protein
LDRSGVGVDLQMVLNHLPRDPGHLRWLPCKHICVSPEEGDEREFLFAVQITRDTGSLSSISPNLNGLHGGRLLLQRVARGVPGSRRAGASPTELCSGFEVQQWLLGPPLESVVSLERRPPHHGLPGF